MVKMKHIKNYNNFEEINESWLHNMAASSLLLLSSLVGFSQNGDPIKNIDKVKNNLISLKDSSSKDLESLINRNIKTLSDIKDIHKLINIDSLDVVDNVDDYLSKLGSLEHNIKLDSLNLNLDSLYQTMVKKVSVGLLNGIDSNLVKFEKVLKDIYHKDSKSLVKDLKELLKMLKSGLPVNKTYQIIIISFIILIIGTIIIIKLS